MSRSFSYRDNCSPRPSYNRYLAVAARTVRRSLKETPRLNAERRGEMDLRFAKWTVSESVGTSRSGGRLMEHCDHRTASRVTSSPSPRPTTMPLLPRPRNKRRAPYPERCSKHEPVMLGGVTSPGVELDTKGIGPPGEALDFLYMCSNTGLSGMDRPQKSHSSFV